MKSSSLTSLSLFSVLATTQATLQCTIPAIQALLPSNASVIFAAAQDAGSTFGNQADIAYPTNATNLPAFCAVVVNVTSSAISSFTFGLGMPVEWNQRYLAVGSVSAGIISLQNTVLTKPQKRRFRRRHQLARSRRRATVWLQRDEHGYWT